MRLSAVLLLLCSTWASAQGSGAAPRIVRGNYLRIPAYKNTSAATYHVNVGTGADTNDCLSTTTPCATIKGTLAKVPKLQQYGTTVTIDAAGTYDCFYLTGFTCDPSVQQASGGILIDATGVFVNSTLASGSATGTATGGTAGSGTTFGTLLNSGAGFTVNDLTGRFLKITGGTGVGQVKMISSNTATAITIVGSWTASDATSTYAIQDPGAIISTACNSVASTQAASGANNAAMLIGNNTCAARTNSVGVQGFRLTNAAGIGVLVDDSSGVVLRLMQIRNSAAASSGLQVGNTANASQVAMGGRLDISDSDLLSNGTSANVISVSSESVIGSGVLIRAGTVGLLVGSTSLQVVSFNSLDVQGSTTPVLLSSGRVVLASTRATCAGAGTGVQVGATSANPVFNNPPAFAGINSLNIATCGIGLLVTGSPGSSDVTTLSGAAATTGIQANGGGSITFAGATTTITGGTQEFSVDGAVTGAFAAIATGSCASTVGLNSNICKR